MKTTRGEIWKLGDHRLAVMDCLNDDITPLFEEKVRLIATDPPYGVAYVENKRGFKGKDGERQIAVDREIANDQLQSSEEYGDFTQKWLEKVAPHLDSYNAAYIFNAELMYCSLRSGMEKAGFYYSQMIIWIKNSVVVGRKDYLPMHELIAYGWYGRHKFERSKGKTVIEHAEVKEDRVDSLMFQDKRSSSKLHPCLPTGQKVYFENQWKPIETVLVGEKTTFGKVIEASEHEANEICEIQLENGEKTQATGNHPFLVYRSGVIAWVESHLIQKNDHILATEKIRSTMKPCIKLSLQKDIGESGTKADSGWSIAWYGKRTMEISQKDTKSITEMVTSSIIELETSRLSLPLSTSGYTPIVDITKAVKKKDVQNVENGNKPQKSGGTSQNKGGYKANAKNAYQNECVKGERYVLNKVGSVRTIHGKTKVHNLTIEGVPAFDTLIGVSHNTMKPVGLMRKLILNSTRIGEVVYDPFGGFGSTLMACEHTKRKCYMVEVDPVYCDTIIARWEKITGKKAEKV